LTKMPFQVAGVLKSPRRFLTVATLTLASAVTSAQTSGIRIPTPRGLNLCKDNDSVASAEKRLAPSIGADYLACFASTEKLALHGSSKKSSLPVEHAVALSISGGPFGREDLDAVLSEVRAQWKSFDPLSKQHEAYLAKLNSLINGSSSQPVPIESVKPVLVSIDRPDDQWYAVVSIREYAIEADGERVRSLKAHAAAVVLQGTRLVRLEIIRELRAPSDVEDVRTKISAWSRAVAANTAKSIRR
jgi:hypothetical protein